MAWETIDRSDSWRYRSPEANFDHPEWAKNQLDNANEALWNNQLKDLYENVDGEVTVSAKKVKKYLTDLSKMDSYNDIWTQFGKNTIPQTTVVQIALEMQGIDVWSVDWIYWSKTTEWVKKFQRANWLSVDGKAGPATIKKMVETFPNLNRSIPERARGAREDVNRRWNQAKRRAKGVYHRIFG